MSKQVEIKKASKSDYWYSKYIGGVFVAEQEDHDLYIVRTPDGTSNIILKSDCVVVENDKVS